MKKDEMAGARAVFLLLSDGAWRLKGVRLIGLKV